MADDYDLYYRVEVKNGGSAGWKGKNIEQIRVAFVKKGDPAPIADNNPKQRYILRRYPASTSRAAVGL